MDSSSDIAGRPAMPADGGVGVVASHGELPNGPAASLAEPRGRLLGIAFAAPLLALSASLANMLSFHNYPWARLEVAMLIIAFALIALAFAFLYRRSSRFGRALLEALLVMFAVDLNFDAPMVAGLCAMAVAFLRLGRGNSALVPLSLIGAVVLVSGLLGLTQRKPAILRVEHQVAAASTNAAVLHLILDEHGGLGGLRDPVFKAELSDFYARHGFRLFERAYSRHFHTVNAVPDILNFGNPGDSRTVDETLDVGRTAYLSMLEKQGYGLNIYQSDFANFCRYSRYSSCTTYWSPSMEFVEPLPIAAAEKASLLTYKFIELSDLAVGLANAYDRLSHQPATWRLGLPVFAPSERSRSHSLGGFAILDRMSDDLRGAKPGNVYFAHVLAPHYPYVMAGDCTVIAPSHWGYRRSSSPVPDREAAYKEQVRCLMHRLDRVIAAFRSSDAGKDGVIIVHGDHGSRITRFDPTDGNRDKLGNDDLMAGFSTLFAVASPTLAPGIDPRPVAAPEILQSFAQSQFTSLDRLEPGSGQVYFDGPSWTVGGPTSIAKAWPATD